MPHKLVDSITSLLCSTRFWLVCSSLPQSSPRAYGDDTDDKIRRLEARITQLEQRLAALEEKATIDKTVKQSSSSAEGWRDKQTWRQLKIGMTKHEVQAILGEPGRISASDLGDHWYFPDPLGGSARFSKEERLNSWSEP